jgi:hypothetical protein
VCARAYASVEWVCRRSAVTLRRANFVAAGTGAGVRNVPGFPDALSPRLDLSQGRHARVANTAREFARNLAIAQVKSQPRRVGVSSVYTIVTNHEHHPNVTPALSLHPAAAPSYIHKPPLLSNDAKQNGFSKRSHQLPPPPRSRTTRFLLLALA